MNVIYRASEKQNSLLLYSPAHSAGEYKEKKKKREKVITENNILFRIIKKI